MCRNTASLNATNSSWASLDIKQILTLCYFFKCNVYIVITGRKHLVYDGISKYAFLHEQDTLSCRILCERDNFKIPSNFFYGPPGAPRIAKNAFFFLFWPVYEKLVVIFISRRAVGPGTGDIATPPRLSVHLSVRPSRLVFAL